MIRDAVWAGILPEQILWARLSEVIETDERVVAKLYVQKEGSGSRRTLAADHRGTAFTTH